MGPSDNIYNAQPTSHRHILRFGIVYPNIEEYVDPDLATRCASLADELGFEVLLTWDHYMYPDSDRAFDAWVFLTHAAAKTERIRLGTCVTPIPFRSPGMLAKMVATLDILSKGRVILGVGAGWHRAEFEGYSVWDDDGGTRVSKTKEGLELMTKLWTERSVDFDGRFYKAKGAILEPKPVQKPYPPMWFGSTGPRMMGLASEYGQGWIPTKVTPQEYRAGVSGLTEKLGTTRDERDFSFVYNLYTPLQTAQEYATSIQEFEEAGCGYYLVNWKYGKDVLLERLKWFAKEVMGSFS
jgi:probable F420-dependent oxidoreductase